MTSFMISKKEYDELLHDAIQFRILKKWFQEDNEEDFIWNAKFVIMDEIRKEEGKR